MEMSPPSLDGMPVVRTIEDFDHRSGHVFERAIFNNRLLIVVACALLTVLLGFQATKLAINAGFEKMIPHGHTYIKNYLESRGSLRGVGNSVRVVVENTDGDIFDPAYLEVLKQVNAVSAWLAPILRRGPATGNPPAGRAAQFETCAKLSSP